MKFAVVDIETTGLFHQGHGITEIAVVHVDEGSARLAFHSLVHPERNIPQGIRHLTGISDQTVADAPTFDSILPELCEALADRIFVAHHVNFDHSFLKANFDAHGRKLPSQRLCTLKLARKLMPGQPSYRLKSLCENLGIENLAAHRATGDAMATAALLLKLIQADDRRIIPAMLGKKGHETVLPAHLSAADVQDLPESPGVYYFYGTGHKAIYIGKAKNLRRRVLSHFTSAGGSRRKQLFQREIQKIRFQITASEYQACLLEDAEIKTHLPCYNLAQKERAQIYAVVLYCDRSGYQRLGIIKSCRRDDALAWFVSPHEAKTWLKAESDVYGWSPKRAGLYQSADFALTFEEEQEGFEQFVVETKQRATQSYVLAETHQDGNHPFALILNGRYRGFGTSNDLITFDHENIHNAPESSTAKAVVRRMLMDDKVLKYPIHNAYV